MIPCLDPTMSADMPQETLTLTIEKLVEGGWGLARQEAEVVLVRGAIPGEKAAVALGKAHKGYREGTVQEVLNASPDRVEAPCPVYGICGGCQLQHLRYEVQLHEKGEMLRETLLRIGKLQLDNIRPVIPSPEPFGYRSTIRFVVFRGDHGFQLGMYREGTNDPVGAEECLLVPDSLRKVISEISGRLAAQAKLPLRLESIEVRRSVAFSTALLIHRTGPTDRARASSLWDLFKDIPDVIGQVVVVKNRRPEQRWVTGQEWLADRLCDLIFRISDRSFMQANWRLYEILARTLADWVMPAEGMRILELYAGIGALGLPLARRGGLVTEVEANPSALADARYAAKANHIGRTRFRRVEAEAMLERVGVGEYDVVLVDPPRNGLSRACVHALIQIGVPRVLYLSCDTPTLARDVGRLCASGYRVARVQPFDMFPQTAHLETLVELVH